MITNYWISVRDDFNFADPANIDFLSHAHDWSVVGGFYPNENAQGRTWALWSVYYPTEQAMADAFAQLQSDNPGQTKSLGGWTWDGVAVINQYPLLARYMPPPGTVEDVNLLAGQSPRQFT